MSPRVEMKELYSILTLWFRQLRISFVFYLKLLIFCWLNRLNRAKKMYFLSIVFSIFLNVFCVEKLQLMTCKKSRVRIKPVIWELTLGFDRLKTTLDRSALAAGCSTPLRRYVFILGITRKFLSNKVR